MKQRCYNPKNHAYKYYGGRGIKICNKWLNDFMSFYNWSINNGYAKGLSIDRINNNGNYEPNNCRWISSSVQMNNTRRNHYVTYKNEIHSIAEWAKILNKDYNKFYKELKNNNFKIVE